MALDTRFPAGMTIPARLCITMSARVGALPVTLQCHETRERCRMNSHAGAWELCDYPAACFNQV